jgi:hypothetical protein
MYTNRRAILSMVALRHITPAEAERLIAACSYEGEAWWLLAGCALCAGLWQLQPHAFAGLVHLLRPVIDGVIPTLHRAITNIATIFGLIGGNQ